MTLRRLLRPACAAGAALLLLTGCSGGDDAAAPAGSSATPTPAASTAPPVPAPTVVATAVVDVVDVFADATATTPEQSLSVADEVSGQLVFVVEEREGERLQVQLPVRPNGSTGWVEAADVSLAQNPYAVSVDLSSYELVVTREGEEVLTAPIGVGTVDRPTPGGTYYVKELLQPPDPGGVYGTYAYGLSGFSTVLESFNGGAGVIGIHGTNAPETIGTEASSGCIRLDNAVVTRLVEEVGLPLGTPVEIRA